MPIQLTHFWKWWFTPRSSDPTVLYRERALRVFLPIITLLRVVAIARLYSGTPNVLTPYFPIWLALAAFIVPVIGAYIFLWKQKINWAGASFVLHWYLTDLLSLPTEGYWSSGFQISMIIQGILGIFFLSERGILPFLLLQIATVGVWGYWLDLNYFDPPLLSSGEPIAVFGTTLVTLAAQETIIVFFIRYLRLQMEKYLRLQQVTIEQLQTEISERQNAEAQYRTLFESSPEGIIIFDPQGLILLANPAACEALGYTPTDLVGRNPLDIIAPHDLEQNPIPEERLRAGEIIQRERVLCQKDGTEFIARGFTCQMADGRFQYIFHNISAQKQAELEVKQHAEQLATIVKISHTVSTLQNIESVLEIIYQQIQRIAPVDTLFICLWDKETQRLSFPLTYDSGVRYNQADANLTPGTPLERALRLGQATRYHRTPAEIAELEKKPGDVGNPQRRSRSLLYVPLWQAEEVIGALSIQSYAFDAYPDELVESITAIGDQAAIAIQNSRLFTNVQQELAERKRAEAQVRELNAELEQRVRERTAELELANKELEAFSYSVSHDLRAPLRAINGFAKILNEDFFTELSPPARNFLRKIIASGEKMGQLIDDLLDFSRIARKPLSRQSVDLNLIVHNVLEILTPETAGRQIEWVLSPLPPITADPILLQQVYANLIGNAVKYSRNRTPARIEIGSFNQNGETVYFVRDNGAGFDMQYVEKLFGVFQRLHRDDEFEGTGIGLATVQRIVQRLGGRIWVEAEVNQGATFYFALE